MNFDERKNGQLNSGSERVVEHVVFGISQCFPHKPSCTTSQRSHGGGRYYGTLRDTNAATEAAMVFGPKWSRKDWMMNDDMSPSYAKCMKVNG